LTLPGNFQSHSRKVSAKNAGLQLLAVLQLEAHLDDATIGEIPARAGRDGYKFQFITLAGFHSLTTRCSSWLTATRATTVRAFVELQQKEFAARERAFTAVKHQREVGTSYFDADHAGRHGGKRSTTALHGSTEG